MTIPDACQHPAKNFQAEMILIILGTAVQAGKRCLRCLACLDFIPQQVIRKGKGFVLETQRERVEFKQMCVFPFSCEIPRRIDCLNNTMLPLAYHYIKMNIL